MVTTVVLCTSRNLQGWIHVRAAQAIHFLIPFLVDVLGS